MVSGIILQSGEDLECSKIKLSFFFSMLNSQARPKDKYELFNLRHAQARNVIEQIFGVLKRRFRILLLAPEYNTEIQSRIPATLVALYNFIRTHDPQQLYSQLDDDNLDHSPGGFYAGDDSFILGGMEVVDEDGSESEATRRRNRIADEMWIQYQQILQQRATEGTSGDITSDDDGDDDDREYSSEEEE